MDGGNQSIPSRGDLLAPCGIELTATVVVEGGPGEGLQRSDDARVGVEEVAVGVDVLLAGPADQNVLDLVAGGVDVG